MSVIIHIAIAMDVYVCVDQLSLYLKLYIAFIYSFFFFFVLCVAIIMCVLQLYYTNVTFYYLNCFTCAVAMYTYLCSSKQVLLNFV